MLHILLALAVLSAIAGVLRRSWTAGALLASFIVSMLLCRLQVEFNVVLWLGLDLMVIAFVARKGMPLTDRLILSLFAPAWALYLWQPSWGPEAIAGIVAVQMLLTFPAEWASWFLREAARFNRTYDPWDGLDLRGRYGVA